MNINRLDNITLVLCIDSHHIEELKIAWKTWKYFKPELTNIKHKVLIYDSVIYDRLSELNFLDSTFTLHSFNNKHYYSSQRDAMLTSWFEGVRKVNTKFYLKIDTDCFAVNNDNRWIEALDDRDSYKIISNPWGYTKNPERIYKLEEWGDSADFIKHKPRLDLKPNVGSNKIIHPRIISFFGIFDTEWTMKITNNCWKNNNHYELPDPSQDTFTWYCAQRRSDPIKRVRFKKFGFAHTRLKNMTELINTLPNI